MIEKQKNIDNANEIVLNNQTYQVDIFIQNSENIFPIPVQAVISLSVTENIYSVFPTIQLIVDNTGNFLENTVRDATTVLRERIFTQVFNFDKDGSETFYISLKPTFNNSPRSKNTESIDQNTIGDNGLSRMGFQGLYYIYDEDEYIEGKATTKQKVFYLRDVREQQLYNSNIEWSTSDVVRSTTGFNYRLSQASNSLRKAKSGDAIKHLLSQALDAPELKVDSDWDSGHTPIFYTSPSQSTAYDDLEYLLDRHVSADTLDNCILKLERSGRFSLRSLNAYYKLGYVPNGLAPFITDIFATDTGAFSVSEDPDVKGVKLPGHGIPEGIIKMFETLTNFSLLHVGNDYSNNNLISSAVHSYDTESKQFGIEMKHHSIEDVVNKHQELYSNLMPGLEQSSKAVSILPVNDNKKFNRLINHKMGPPGTFDERLPVGGNRTLQHSIDLAPAINFEVPGSGHRTTGRFILFSLNNADKDSPMTRLLVGEWFTTQINHAFIFSQNAYVNNITCVKSHVSSESSNIDPRNIIDIPRTPQNGSMADTFGIA